MSVRRIYVEKRQDYAVKAKELKDELKTYLGISGIDSIRILIRYDMENISDEIYKKALVNVFSAGKGNKGDSTVQIGESFDFVMER